MYPSHTHTSKSCMPKHTFPLTHSPSMFTHAPSKFNLKFRRGTLTNLCKGKHISEGVCRALCGRSQDGLSQLGAQLTALAIRAPLCAVYCPRHELGPDCAMLVGLWPVGQKERATRDGASLEASYPGLKRAWLSVCNKPCPELLHSLWWVTLDF